MSQSTQSANKSQNHSKDKHQSHAYGRYGCSLCTIGLFWNRLLLRSILTYVLENLYL